MKKEVIHLRLLIQLLPHFPHFLQYKCEIKNNNRTGSNLGDVSDLVVRIRSFDFRPFLTYSNKMNNGYTYKTKKNRPMKMK